MGFLPISLDDYVNMHLENNPDVNEMDLRNRLNIAISDFKNGVKCSCGNDIWVIGSASVGNRCFTCVTGESFPKDDYEIDLAVKKNESKKDRRHIDEINPAKISGLFDDDGYEINTALIKKPSLCMLCINDEDQDEEILCNLTRFDQKDDKEFKCFAFRTRKNQ